MRYALTEKAVREAEEHAIAQTGETLAELMERAGSSLAEAVQREAPSGEVAVVCGNGNNGGDGWVAARLLAAAGRQVVVYTTRDPAELDGIAGDAAVEAADAGVRSKVTPEPLESGALHDATVIIDAMFGIGFQGDPRPPYDSWIESVNAAHGFVIAADMPSGVATDTGQTGRGAVRADLTVTFSALKPGLLFYPGAEFAGRVEVADVGIAAGLLGTPGDVELWDTGDYVASLPFHAADVHKNARGRVLVVAGSGAYPGAAVLAAMGAQRAGAGYVTVAVPDSVLPVVQTKLTSAVGVGMPENPTRTFASRSAEEILDLAREHDAVVLGPGLTVAHGAVLVARKVVKDLALPLVVDADGLNALVDATGLLTERGAPTLITPHPGELARLLQVETGEIQGDRLFYGARLSGDGLVCVLKGARTVVSGSGRSALNLSGGPALATAGSGDVLAGMMGALLAQGVEPFDAGVLGTHLHGLAGDRAAARLTDRCVIAEDLPGFVPEAMKGLLGG